jgi:uncharacterized protein
MSEFLTDYAGAFGGDDRFSLFIRGLSRLGGSRDAELRILEGEERRRAVDALRQEAVDRGLRLSTAASEGGVCYAARGNSFVIRADGRVNKCTVALEAPENQVGRLLPDGALRLRSDAVRPWMRGFGSGATEALACPMKGLVQGPRAIPLVGAPSAASA